VLVLVFGRDSGRSVWVTRSGWAWHLSGALVGVLLSVSCGDEESDPHEDDVPIPAACADPGTRWADDDGCELDIDCSGTWMSVICNAEGDAFDCSLLGNSFYFRYSLAEVSAADACLASVAAYLQEPPFEGEPFECSQISEQHDEDSCSAADDCTRDATLGDVEITDHHERRYGCAAGDAGTTCTCHEPIEDLWFEMPDMSVSEASCADVGKWCLGEEVELIGERDCTPIQQQWDIEICLGQIECKEPVKASGREATKHDIVELRCDLTSDARYECICPELGSFSIDAEDAESACYEAIDICAGG